MSKLKYKHIAVPSDTPKPLWEYLRRLQTLVETVVGLHSGDRAATISDLTESGLRLEGEENVSPGLRQPTEVLLGSIDIGSAVANITFNTIEYSSKLIRLEFINVKVSANADLLIQFGYDGTIDTGANYDYAVNTRDSGGVWVFSDAAAQTSINLTGSSGVLTAGDGLSGVLSVYDFGNPTIDGVCKHELCIANANLAIVSGVGRHATSTNRDMIRLLTSTGNLTSGTVRLYSSPDPVVNAYS